ncbi:MAG TPA: gamma-butyrobetaine hydroxylase-like domain-containing protein, partial [Chloroflexia bacterium]|nr:gamma-butyrobetaine hydroxylase-like domain-containing protein [Chloroflexia bacterium]
MKIIEPVGLEADERINTLFIAWSDGHQSQHNITHLRWLCPCAECKGEWGAPGKLAHTRELSARQTTLEDM